MAELYVETESSYNFRVPQDPNLPISMEDFLGRWLKDAKESGGYYHAEEKMYFPWHSITRVAIK